MSKKPAVVLLSGGLTSGSSTNIALSVVAKALEDSGCTTRLISVGDHPLPLLGVGEEYPAAVEQLRDWVTAADGLVVGSPEYHAAPSGALKNMIDYLRSEDVSGKPTGLVAICGSPKGGTNTLNSLRITFRSLHAPVLVEQAICTSADFEGGRVAAPEALDYLHRVADGLVREIRHASAALDNTA